MPDKPSLDAAASALVTGTPGTSSFVVTQTSIDAGTLNDIRILTEASGGRMELVSGQIVLFYSKA